MKMLTYNITTRVEPQKELKWRRALRIATQSPDRWTWKTVEWNLGLIISTKTQRRAGRAKRWEDDLIDWFCKKMKWRMPLKAMIWRTTIHGLLLLRTSTNWKKKEDTMRQTRYRRLKNPTQLPATTWHHQQKRHHTNNCNTTTKTQCSSVHRREQQHHDEDPMHFVDIDIQLFAKFLNRGIRMCATSDLRITQYAICRIRGQISFWPPSQRATNILRDCWNNIVLVTHFFVSVGGHDTDLVMLYSRKFFLRHSWANSAHHSIKYPMLFRRDHHTIVMPAGPDAQHMLAPSSISVVMVIVIVRINGCWWLVWRCVKLFVSGTDTCRVHVFHGCAAQVHIGSLLWSRYDGGSTFW